MKNVVTFFVMGMLVFYCAALVLLFSTFKYKETTGIVTRIGNEKTSLGLRSDYLVIEYKVKNEDYKLYRTTNLINNKKIGDKYNVIYNSDNPKITRADYKMILFFELGTFSLIMSLFSYYFMSKKEN